MKKVIIKETNTEVTTHDKTSLKCFYGISRDGNKGFIIRSEFMDGEFRFVTKDGVTLGDGWSYYNSADFQDAIYNWIADGGDVYEFDSANKLFAWLSVDK